MLPRTGVNADWVHRSEVDGSLTLQIALIKIERVTFRAFLAVAQSVRRRASERTCFTRRARIASGRSLTNRLARGLDAARIVVDCGRVHGGH
jgi:hypothetical protein